MVSGSHLSTHAPAVHPPKHACPHAPQSAGDLEVSTQRDDWFPSAGQYVSVAVGHTHAPLEQTVPGWPMQSAVSRQP